MVDESRSPIDFRALDLAHVALCAREGRCGVCGGKIRRGPIAFIGPTEGERSCFGDPWMHPECARLAVEQCPFINGRRSYYREGSNEVSIVYEEGMGLVLAHNWRSHLAPDGVWHFEAIGAVVRE
jgi:hypothetical protein